jgi:hypothetical protein
MNEWFGVSYLIFHLSVVALDAELLMKKLVSYQKLI